MERTKEEIEAAHLSAEYHVTEFRDSAVPDNVACLTSSDWEWLKQRFAQAFFDGADYAREQPHEVKAERDKYKAALEWYADQDNYNIEGAPCNDRPSEENGDFPTDLDFGERARVALNAKARR